ncbi:hypothetical protein SK3146_04549 [Paenibacillus konkukensis]|uniref:LTD domain-containing protein n=1 Tax=Paenibacillus konkukensis TaxID=2020716 RepID=A0ABY4RSR4_9BACL|nr:DUF2278 family protein [Paenibacillus konkukensis]UQZ85260.1 hypothetical protein SK3146_04549 [Paenibacillus konkukensis]
MTIRYGVLKCKVRGRRPATRENAHYQVHAEAEGVHYRIAINVKSQMRPFALLYYTDEHFEHEVTSDLPELAYGYTRLPNRPGGMALDYIRGNLFDRRRMVPLAFDVPGTDNDLNDKLDIYMRKAMEFEDAVLYAYGDIWGPELKQRDAVFGFMPGQGMHDIHMNQGNGGSYRRDNGVYQDGGLLLHFPSEERWIAIFLAFQAQSWHTDDKTGDPLHEAAAYWHPAHPRPLAEHEIFIAGALVLPASPTACETVTLLNASDRPIDIGGWSLANKLKQKYKLEGVLAPGQFYTIELSVHPKFFRPWGDIITLLDERGLKVHGVSYIRAKVRSGWTIRF